MANETIVNWVQDALAKLQAFNAKNTAADVAAIITELQPASDALAAIQDEPTLNLIQSTLRSLEDERGRKAALYPDFAAEWMALEDENTTIGVALVTQFAALPSPNSTTLASIQSLLQTLLGKISAASPTTQLAALEARVVSLQKEMTAQSQQQQTAFAAIQASVASMRARLDTIYRQMVQGEFQICLAAFVDFLNGANNGTKLLAKERQMLDAGGSFGHLQWAFVRHCNLQYLVRLIAFVDLIEAGNDDLSIPADPARAAALRPLLMQVAVPNLTSEGNYVEQQVFAWTASGSFTWDDAKEPANFPSMIPFLVGRQIHVSDPNIGTFAGVITSVTVPQFTTTIVITFKNEDGATMTITSTSEYSEASDEGWEGPGPLVTTYVSYEGAYFRNPESAIVIDLPAGHNQILLQSRCVKRDVLLEKYRLGDPKTILADIKSAFQTSAS